MIVMSSTCPLLFVKSALFTHGLESNRYKEHYHPNTVYEKYLIDFLNQLNVCLATWPWDLYCVDTTEGTNQPCCVMALNKLSHWIYMFCILCSLRCSSTPTPLQPHLCFAVLNCLCHFIFRPKLNVFAASYIDIYSKKEKYLLFRLAATAQHLFVTLILWWTSDTLRQDQHLLTITLHKVDWMLSSWNL